jgi:deoxycytidine triphosphate deaminase
MIINPATVIENKWIEFPDWMTEETITDCIQPNAIDFTLDRLFRCGNTARQPYEIARTSKTMPTYEECVADIGNRWALQAGYLYDGMSDFKIHVPEHVAVTLIVRSTLNRCGVQLNAGLYDQGFSNNIGFMLYPFATNSVMIERGTRVGQVVFHEAMSDGNMYTGSYSKPQDGQHWSVTMK